MFMAFSMVSALLHAQRTGEGQVIDCAMVDGAGLLMTPFYELYAQGLWQDKREENALDGGAPFYRTYETSDGKHVCVGPLEPQFFAIFLDKLGLADDPLFASQYDKAAWLEMTARLAAVFRSKPRDDWADIFADSDACVAPVLSLGEAPTHGLAVERESFVEVNGVKQPAPGPRFSRTKLDKPKPPTKYDIEDLL